MKRLARQDDNPVAVQWLRDKLQSGKPFLWIGYGLSFALAQAFAEILQRVGVLSFALTPGEASLLKADVHLGYISRSGKPMANADFLVTQEGNDVSWTTAQCLSIPVVDEGRKPWLALDYTEQVLLMVSPMLWVTFDKKCCTYDFTFSDGFEVAVFDDVAKSVHYLFQASNDKLNSSSLIAIGRDEIGHGFHYKLWSSPKKYNLHLLMRPGEELLWTPLYQWADSLGISVHKMLLGNTTLSPHRVVERFCIALDMIRLWAELHNVQIERKPLPEHIDQLRWESRVG
jgi:hypothetical protein